MQKRRVGSAIIWSMGLLSLALFLLLRLLSGEWKRAMLIPVVVFFGWGLERAKGHKRSQPHLVYRFLGSIATAIVSGLVCLYVGVSILMHLGSTYHDSYDYYTLKYPVLFFAPGIVGFFLPSLVAWILRRVGWRKEE